MFRRGHESQEVGDANSILEVQTLNLGKTCPSRSWELVFGKTGFLYEEDQLIDTN